MHRGTGAEHSRVRDDKRFWSRIWKLNVPPKVRNFVWRACTDILPTRANLYRRKIPIDPLCSICKQTDETVEHAIWECPLASNVWAVAQGRLQKCVASAQCFFLLEILEDYIVFLNEKIYISALYRRHKCAVQVKCSTSINVLYK